MSRRSFRSASPVAIAASTTEDPASARMAAGANALPLDDAPYLTTEGGTRARFGLCPVHMLLENPHRVMVHPRRQIEKLGRSITATGQLTPILIDEGYCILAGHARLAAAKSLSWQTVPVVQVQGLSTAQKRAFLLADNRIGADARLDRKALAEQLPELTLLFEEVQIDLSDTGYETAELDELVLSFDDETDGRDDAIDPALLDERVCVQLGDHFDLGAHSLIVGDSRNPTVLDALMGGAQAEAAFLDPPYNVRVRDIGGRGRVQHPEFAHASGEMSRAEFVVFLQASLGNAARVSRAGAVHFVCMDWKHVRELIEAGEGVYGAYLNLVTWVKTNAGQGGLYRSQHELVGVFRVGFEPHRDNVQMGRFGRNRTNVWTYPGASGFGAGRLADLAAHPTVKPVQLVADALRDVTRREAVVLDTFVGSGTTILAGELVGRWVRAVELEPRYAQIAIQRWETRTGREAVHRATGLTLRALAEHRTSAADNSSLGSEPNEAVTIPSEPAPPLRIRERIRRRAA